MQRSAVIKLVLSWFSFVVAVPVHLQDFQATVTLLSETTSQGRHRRGLEDPNMPTNLVFHVPMGSRDSGAVLDLEVTNLLPVTTGNDAITRLANHAPENAAVYTDVTRNSAVIVRRHADSYKLEGTFHHSDQEWNIQPVITGSDAENDTHEHRVSKLKPKHKTISLDGDEIPRPEGLSSSSSETSENKGDHSPHRQKRAFIEHVVEICFVVDYADYNKFLSYYLQDAFAQLRLWYTYVAELINIRYQSIKNSAFSIRTIVTHLRVLTTEQEAAFIKSIAANGVLDGNSGLNEFSKWSTNKANVPQSDHYMLFTGFDIAKVAGIAFGATTCTTSGVSLVENSFDGLTGAVAAHELGHSLSADHDDQSQCSDSDQYVMAAAFQTPVEFGNEGNPWRFSTCSIESFKRYLEQQTCTLPENTAGADVMPGPAIGQKAGQVLTRDAQCRFHFRDVRSFYCKEVQDAYEGENRLCGVMYCSIPGDAKGYCETVIPQEYTPCETNKWCIAGVCVEKVTATTAISTTTTTIPTTTTIIPTTTTTIPTTTTTIPTSATTIGTTTTRPTTTLSYTTTSAVAAKASSNAPPTTTTKGTAQSQPTPTAAAAKTTPFKTYTTTTTTVKTTPFNINNYCLVFLRRGSYTDWWWCMRMAQNQLG